MALERPLESLSDDALLRGLEDAVRSSRRVESGLLAHIAEVEARRLYAREACPSMFAYCTDVLHLSESEAYLRTTAARAAREHPLLLTMLEDGRLHLSGIAKLAGHLTHENRDRLLARAVHKSKREIEELLAELAPRPDAPGVLRKLPSRPMTPDRAASRVTVLPIPDQVESTPTPRPDPVASIHFEPLSPARYKVQFTASAGLREKLERLRALLRSEVPDGDLAAIVEKAVTEKLERLEARRFAQTRTSRPDPPQTAEAPSSRHIPAAVRRAVYRRDGGRCRFVDSQGRACPERHRLEYHHRHPFGFGGNHDPGNVCLMCPAHNRYIAEIDYGRKALFRTGSRLET
jgi:hypothetical protein